MFGFFSENLENYIKLVSWRKDCISVLDMSNKNENIFCIISCPGGLLKFDIMVHKANVLTYIWSFFWKFGELQNTEFTMKRLHISSK